MQLISFQGFVKYKLIFFFFKFYYLNLLTTQQNIYFLRDQLSKREFSIVQLEALNHLSLNPQYFYQFFLKKYLIFSKWILIAHKKDH